MSICICTALMWAYVFVQHWCEHYYVFVTYPVTKMTPTPPCGVYTAYTHGKFFDLWANWEISMYVQVCSTCMWQCTPDAGEMTTDYRSSSIMEHVEMGEESGQAGLAVYSANCYRALAGIGILNLFWVSLLPVVMAMISIETCCVLRRPSLI